MQRAEAIVEIRKSDFAVGPVARQRFVDQSPAEVYAELLDQGLYPCSIRTLYRILPVNGEVRERRRQRRHPACKEPELIAEGANQVWSWDISKLRGPARWTYFYL